MNIILMMKTLHFDSIDSTNKYLIDNNNLFDDFTFVFAKYQSDGKGREQRKWISNKDENILSSYLLKNPKFTSKFQLFSICTAVSIMNVLRKNGVKNVSIKWPNDVYVNDKKICGILLQGSLPNYVVIGIGLNVNQICFNDEYRTTPTSISLELKEKQDINKLENEIISEVIYMSEHIDEYIKLAQESDYLNGKQFMYRGSKVKCLGIQDDASLKVVNEHNQEIIINSSEIIL